MKLYSIVNVACESLAGDTIEKTLLKFCKSKYLID